MIDLYFMDINNEITIFRIMGNTVTIAVNHLGVQHYAPLDLITFRKEGILKEHPDLEGKPDTEIRQIALQRLKDKISSLGGENFIKRYIIDELTKMGFKYKGFKQPGFREVKE
jgi:hypothetical protein